MCELPVLIDIHHRTVSTEQIRIGILSRWVHVEPSPQHGIVESGPEVVPFEHRTAEVSVLQLLPAEQIFVLVQVAVLERETEGIEIGRL